VPCICYVPRTFSTDSQAVIDRANLIFAEYEAAGYVLTLRQLYYRFVAGSFLDALGFKPDKESGSTNCEASYKRLGSIINDARLAGLIDWELMEDRTRSLKKQPSWDNPAEIIDAVASQFRIDKWATQKYRPEVFIEKDALAGVIDRVCAELQVPYFSCRGYTSQSEMWVAGQRLKGWIDGNQTPIIFHFGDHDPSGLDMTRDIIDRLGMFMGGTKLKRLALNMDQVEEHAPPPNPTKVTDSRAAGYIREFGHECWELDALPPDVLAGLVREAVLGVRDEKAWKKAVKVEEEHRRLLGEVSSQWESITEGL
jgi:hypothetical protein